MIIKFLVAVPLVALGACGTITSYPVADVPELTFDVTDTKLTFVSTDGARFTLDRDAAYDRGPFVGAMDASGEYKGMIAIYQSEDATALVAVRYDVDSLHHATSYERLTQVDRPLIGTATYSGTLVSALVGAPGSAADLNNSPTLMSSDMTLAVDFLALTVSGEVTNRALTLLGFPSPFVLSSPINQIELLPTALSPTGTFAGVTVYNGAPNALPRGTYDGLIAGENGAEAVGAIRIGDETGAFAVSRD